MSESSPGLRENDTDIPRGLTPTVAGDALRKTAAQARRWLFEETLPLWASVGHDDAHGGFFEQIDFDSVTPVGLPKRCRVQARQIYSFCEAGRLGWNGPWRERAQSGLDFMLRHHRRADGLMRFTTAREGAPVDDSVDNYDQAFAIFGLAHGQALDAGAAEIARNLLAALRQDRAHPLGGFREGTAGPAPLLANPHMHFFEAALAWLDVAPQPAWRDLADEIARLCQDRFIDPRSGALREYFESDWTPSAGEKGRIVEPGHQFEWAWLLLRWRAHGHDVDLSIPRRLYDFADRHGLNARQPLTVSETLDDGVVRDGGARLWPQTERLKAAIAFARLYPEERRRFEADAEDAWRGLQLFIDDRNPGLFRDKRRPDGSFAQEGALASSLYHIVGGVSELVRYAGLDGDA
jgi:mannose/cellobiose epimerase-like protein (N-acyl-D-glucosamine 2-epimerase family)